MDWTLLIWTLIVLMALTIGKVTGWLFCQHLRRGTWERESYMTGFRAGRCYERGSASAAEPPKASEAA